MRRRRGRPARAGQTPPLAGARRRTGSCLRASAIDNMRFSVQIAAVPHCEQERRIADTLEQVSLMDRRDDDRVRCPGCVRSVELGAHNGVRMIDVAWCGRGRAVPGEPVQVRNPLPCGLVAPMSVLPAPLRWLAYTLPRHGWPTRLARTRPATRNQHDVVCPSESWSAWHDYSSRCWY